MSRALAPLERPLDRPASPVRSCSIADEAGALADEVDAFLRGRLVQHLVAARRPVPAWTVLNTVAHSTWADLVDLAAEGVGSSDRDTAAVRGGVVPVWQSGPRQLAAMLLACGSIGEVARLQRTVLVPLELWLIGRAAVETITARRAVEITSDALDAVIGPAGPRRPASV